MPSTNERAPADPWFGWKVIGICFLYDMSKLIGAAVAEILR
jgi:hypothetical protein